MHHVDAYVAHRVATGELVASSAATTAPILRQWHRHAGPIEQWSTTIAAEWVHAPHLRPNSRKGRLSRLRPYTAWLTAAGVLAVDVSLGVAPVKIPPPDPRDLAPADVAALLAAAPDERGRLVVLLMVHCGLRCVDVSRARVEDVDVARRTLAVRAKGGRGEVTHTVPVPAEAWEALAAHLAALGRRAGPLVCSLRRRSPTAVSANRLSVLVRRWVADAGLKVVPYDGVSAHALRHTCAQGMIDAGADIRLVQSALGHRHVTTTETYLRRRPPGLREAMDGRRYVT
jgi:integrase